MAGLSLVTGIHDRLIRISDAAWEVDLEVGTIVFTTPGVRAEAPVQVVGTHLSTDGSWLWSWANPSIPTSLTDDAQRVRAFGEKDGYPVLTTARMARSELQCWELTALALHLSSASQGAYSGPQGATRVFFTFGVLSTEQGRGAC